MNPGIRHHSGLQSNRVVEIRAVILLSGTLRVIAELCVSLYGLLDIYFKRLVDLILCQEL